MCDNGYVSPSYYPYDAGFGQRSAHTIENDYNTIMNESMMRTGNFGKPATIYDVAELIGKAFPLAFTLSNIMQRFKVSGIEPLNENVFHNHEFLLSNVIYQPMAQLKNQHFKKMELWNQIQTYKLQTYNGIILFLYPHWERQWSVVNHYQHHHHQQASSNAQSHIVSPV